MIECPCGILRVLCTPVGFLFEGSTRDIFVDPTTILLCRNNIAACYDTQKVKTHGYRIDTLKYFILSARASLCNSESIICPSIIIYDLKWLHEHANGLGIVD